MRLAAPRATLGQPNAVLARGGLWGAIVAVVVGGFFFRRRRR